MQVDPLIIDFSPTGVCIPRPFNDIVMGKDLDRSAYMILYIGTWSQYRTCPHCFGGPVHRRETFNRNPHLSPAGSLRDFNVPHPPHFDAVVFTYIRNDAAGSGVRIPLILPHTT
jgi:hypothetical protein